MLGLRHASLLVAAATQAAAAARVALASGCSRAALGVLTALGVLGLAASAQAGARMYTGSLIIHAFGNDASSSYIGIPLTGNCNQAPYRTKETLTFPTTPTGTQTFMITIPAYGGAVLTGGVDTNGDTLPDFPAGCAPDTVKVGDPLTGAGPVNTTGATNTARATNDPRKFTLPIWALRKQKSGASLDGYNVYLWDVHFADLHNDVGVFSKGGGDGTFLVTHPGRRANQTAGKNQFGGVMQLLGSYRSSEGYLYANFIRSVFPFDWLFNYLGHGGQATAGGVVTRGYTETYPVFYYTLDSGYYAPAGTVSAEVFKWTTGTVTVTASGSFFPTVLQRNGYDNRTPMGSGAVQLVSPMLTKWTGIFPKETASIGILKVNFAPEPSEWMLLTSGISMLGLMAWLRRRRR